MKGRKITTLLFIVCLLFTCTVFAENELTPVGIGVPPYSMYQVWPVAHELGIDREFGLNFVIKEFTSTAPGAEALVRGDIDISGNCIAEHLAVIKGAPQLKSFSSVGYFKGFFFVGRKSKIKPFEELKKTMGLEKAKAYRLKEFKGKTFCEIPQRKPFIMDTIGQVGLTEKDVKFLNFADDQKAAMAFMSGSGDFYIGSLPQQQKLVGISNKFVNAGGSEILGPAGTWYDTMISTDKFMKENRETALRTIACLYKTINYFYKNQTDFAKIASKNLSRLTGGNNSVTEYIQFQTVYDEFLTLDKCKETMYNTNSPLYWKNPVEYYIKLLVADGTLNKQVSSEEYYGEAERLFFELTKRDDLIKIINQ